MSSPQQPEIRRRGLGNTVQDSREAHITGEDTPGGGGDAHPTPAANRTEDERRSGTKSTARKE